MISEKITITDKFLHIEINWDNRGYKIPMSVIKDEADLMYEKVEPQKLLSIRYSDLQNCCSLLREGKMTDNFKAEYPPEILLTTWYYNVLSLQIWNILTEIKEKNLIEDFKEIFAARMQFMDAYIVY